MLKKIFHVVLYSIVKSNEIEAGLVNYLNFIEGRSVFRQFSYDKFSKKYTLFFNFRLGKWENIYLKIDRKLELPEY